MTTKPMKTEKVILVVEDENSLLGIIKEQLELNGFTVATARTVEEAIGQINAFKKVDAIWLDHYLLGEDSGLDFVIKLKENDKWKKIPVFVVSNSGSVDVMQSYMQLLVAKYYVKAEHRLDEIISEIKLFLDRSEE